MNQVKIQDRYNHLLRPLTFKEGKFQQHYVVFDTETVSEELPDGSEKHSFRCVSAIFVENMNVVMKRIYWSLPEFWKDFLSFCDEKKEVICTNVNIGFDMRIVNVFTYLKNVGYSFDENFYVKNHVTIMSFFKHVKTRKHVIHFYDIQNYFAKVSVKTLGEEIGLPKLEIDFDTCSKEELEIYALRDAEIVWEYFKTFIEFLMKHELVSRLKPTLSSLAFATYRTNFYHEPKIFIHNWINVIKLERAAYKGGITDVFLKDVDVDECYYVDVNSMYASILHDEWFPTRLIAHKWGNHENQDKLWSWMNKCFKLNEYTCIARVTYENYDGYVLQQKDDIKCNVVGTNLEGSFCLPELQYILEHGNIIYIHEIAIYECEKLFTSYVDFFQALKDVTQGVQRTTAKGFNNHLYGKWGQREEALEKINTDEKNAITLIIRDNEVDKTCLFKHVAQILGKCEIYYIKPDFYKKTRKTTNAFNAFVAISALATSHARVKLMNARTVVERASNNIDVYNCDTDSLFISKRGYEYMVKEGMISDNLGYFKLEGIGKARFRAPKDYIFDHKRKAKGIKRSLLMENVNTYDVVEFTSLMKGIKNDEFDHVIVKHKTKTLTGSYQKGSVLPTGVVKPFTFNDRRKRKKITS